MSEGIVILDSLHVLLTNTASGIDEKRCIEMKCIIVSSSLEQNISSARANEFTCVFFKLFNLRGFSTKFTA